MSLAPQWTRPGRIGRRTGRTIATPRPLPRGRTGAVRGGGMMPEPWQVQVSEGEVSVSITSEGEEVLVLPYSSITAGCHYATVKYDAMYHISIEKAMQEAKEAYQDRIDMTEPSNTPD